MEDYEQTILNSGPKSSFNSAGLINARMHECWKLANNYSLQGKYNSWNAVLDNIWTELGGEYEQDSVEQKEYDKFSFILGLCKNWTVSNNGFKQRTKNDLKEMARQYIILRRKELFIKRIQNQQGKGTAYADEDQDLM
jgi:hypothetical protein